MRWIWRLFIFFSFILFTAAVSLWVRSYLLVDRIQHLQVERTSQTLAWNYHSATNWRGGVSIGISRNVWTLPHREMSEEQIGSLRTGWQYLVFDGNRTTSNYHGLKQPTKFGFAQQRIEINSHGATVRGSLTVFPWWAPVLFLGIVPFFWTIGFMKKRQRLTRLRAVNYNGMQTRKLAA
jgi:hypothetical protein